MTSVMSVLAFVPALLCYHAPPHMSCIYLKMIMMMAMDARNREGCLVLQAWAAG